MSITTGKRTLVWLFTCMNAAVSRWVATGGECFVAAGKRAGVSPFTVHIDTVPRFFSRVFSTFQWTFILKRIIRLLARTRAMQRRWARVPCFTRPRLIFNAGWIAGVCMTCWHNLLWRVVKLRHVFERQGSNRLYACTSTTGREQGKVPYELSWTPQTSNRASVWPLMFSKSRQKVISPHDFCARGGLERTI